MRGCSLTREMRRPLNRLARKQRLNAKRSGPIGRAGGFAGRGWGRTSDGSAKIISGWSLSPGRSSAMRQHPSSAKLWSEPSTNWCANHPRLAHSCRILAITTMRTPVGTLTNGGIWPSINGTLIWALALENGASAWDEWKKNSLAMHAEAYPEIWYGIWSGPDTYNSVLSRYPGQTMFAEPPSSDHKVQSDWGFNWTDFPVMNMHPHAWPLYSAAKLLGLEFHEKGVSFRPDLPLTEYEFASSLLGFKKTGQGYSGWYAPAAPGRWDIELRLSASETRRMKRLTINGSVGRLSKLERVIRFAGEGDPDKPLRWEIS